VDAVDLLARINDQRNRDSVSDGGRVAFVGFRDPKAGLVLCHSPSDTTTEVPESFGADLRQKCVVEASCTQQIVRPERRRRCSR
jgi:hypothetical protein